MCISSYRNDFTRLILKSRGEASGTFHNSWSSFGQNRMTEILPTAQNLPYAT